MITFSVLAIIVLGLAGLIIYTFRAIQRLDPANDADEIERDRKFRHEHGSMAEQSWP